MRFLKASVIFVMLVVLFAALAISGCASPTPTAAPTTTAAPTATPAPASAALTITGNVSKPLSLTLDDLKTYPQLTINETTKNKANVTTVVSGTGPSLNALITAAGPASTATNITFKSSDSPPYVKTIALSVVTGSPNATVIIFKDGGLRDIIPGQGAGAWVSNLTAIEIS